ncbi:hypothetical protein EZS27_037612, partial [termite gut metagenome]
MVIPKNEYLHGFISRSKEIISMKKIFIALALIFGITIAAQNNTAGQEKIYTQKEVNLMMQVQDLERQVVGTQKDIQCFQREIELRKDTLNDKIGMQDKYIEKQDKRIDLFMIFISIIVALAGIIEYKNFTSRKQEANEDLKELMKIKEEVIKDKAAISEIINQAKEELLDIKKIKEEIQSDKAPNEQTPELQKEIKSYTEKTTETKTIAEYTADDWFFLGYDAHIQKRYEDACFYYWKAHEIDSNNANIYNNWGIALSDLAKLKSNPALFYYESIDKYKKAADNKPNYDNTRYNWLLALKQLTQHEKDIEKLFLCLEEYLKYYKDEIT